MKEEILRFVKLSEREPTKDGMYVVRVEGSNWAFSMVYFTDDRKFRDLALKEVKQPLEWLEIIPAKEPFDRNKVEIKIYLDYDYFRVIFKYEDLRLEWGISSYPPERLGESIRK